MAPQRAPTVYSLLPRFLGVQHPAVWPRRDARSVNNLKTHDHARFLQDVPRTPPGPPSDPQGSLQDPPGTLPGLLRDPSRTPPRRPQDPPRTPPKDPPDMPPEMSKTHPKTGQRLSKDLRICLLQPRFFNLGWRDSRSDYNFLNNPRGSLGVPKIPRVPSFKKLS